MCLKAISYFEKKIWLFYVLKHCLLSIITILDLNKYSKCKKVCLEIERKFIFVLFIIVIVVKCINVAILIFIF